MLELSVPLVPAALLGVYVTLTGEVVLVRVTEVGEKVPASVPAAAGVSTAPAGHAPAIGVKVIVTAAPVAPELAERDVVYAVPVATVTLPPAVAYTLPPTIMTVHAAPEPSVVVPSRPVMPE